MIRHRYIAAAGLLLTLTIAGTTASHADDPPDPFMGDWQGALTLPDGTQKPLCAQVICWGKDGYQANVLAAFDRRIKPTAVLKGALAEGVVSFGDLEF